MALKGKTKKTQRHRPKPVARPPKAAVAKRSPHRRRLDAVLVIGTLFVVTLVVAIVWVLVAGNKPKPVAGLDAYSKATAESVKDLENVSTELADAANSVAAAQPGDDLSAAFARADGLGTRLQSTTDTLAAQNPQGQWAGAAGVLQTSVKVLREGVAVLSLAESSEPQEMQAQMAMKAARLAAASDALRSAARRDLDAVANSKDFLEQASDFVQWPAPPGAVEGPPLLGLVPALPPPPSGGDPVTVDADGSIDVVLDTQQVADYGSAAGGALSALDASIAPMGEVVRATETTQDYAGLQLSATEWFQATRTAYAALAATPRPDKGGIEDVALVNSLWLLQESTRSFASTATDRDQSTDLLDDAKKLRLLSDELRRTATTGFAAVSVQLSPSTESGFDPTLIGPATTGPGAVPGGAVPGGAVPGAVPPGGP